MFLNFSSSIVARCADFPGLSPLFSLSQFLCEKKLPYHYTIILSNVVHPIKARTQRDWIHWKWCFLTVVSLFYLPFILFLLADLSYSFTCISSELLWFSVSLYVACLSKENCLSQSSSNFTISKVYSEKCCWTMFPQRALPSLNVDCEFGSYPRTHV